MPQRWPVPIEPINSPPLMHGAPPCFPKRKHRLHVADRWLICKRCGYIPERSGRARRGLSRRYLTSAYGSQCFYCGIDFSRFEAMYTIDHWWPRGRRGKDRVKNLRPCCSDCNTAKDSMRPRQFARSEWLRLRREWVALVYGDVPRFPDPTKHPVFPSEPRA